MKCKNLKIKLNRTIYCNKLKKYIQFKDCNNCKFKEYKKSTINQEILCKNHQKNAKISKLERNRFSLFTDNKDECMFCENTTNLTWHEIFRGKNRANSMKYGLCLRMCIHCHERWQEDNSFNDYWHKLAQIRFMQYYNKSEEDFIEIFRKNYLHKKTR